ncbi:2'-5' RNA ligase family protein [Thermaurantiacus sp.]
MAPVRPLILTLALPRRIAAQLDALRRAHDPAPRHPVPAHLTLFRHLPGPSMPVVLAAIDSAAAHTQPFPIAIGEASAWGDSIVLPVRSPALQDLHNALSERLFPMLIPADSAAFRPHITLANHLDRQARNRSLDRLKLGWPRPLQAEAQGLQLWRYDDGPWSLLVRRALRR